jgi:hypothetical protein
MQKWAALLFLASIPGSAATLFSETWSGDSIGFGKTSLMNWTVLGGTNVDVLSGFAGCTGNCVDMDGSFGLSNGDIQTLDSFNFIAGHQYTISFTLSNNAFAGNGVRVRIGSLYDQDFAAPSPNAGFIYSDSFVAAATELAALRITSTGPADNGGGVIDNILLTHEASAVPEPSSLALFGGGVAALLAVRRLRSR